MNEEVIVSIVMATFNGEKYISAQIESILSQSFQNFELIIVDDCSTDNTKCLLESFGKIDSRVTIFHNEKNIGVLKSFERGIKETTGHFIALSDQDDIWLKNHLSTLICTIKTKSLVFSDCRFMYNEEVSDKRFSEIFNWVHKLSDTNLFTYLLFSNFVKGSSCLFSSDLKKYMFPFPNQLPMHDHWIAFVAHCANGIIKTGEVTSLYRRHDKTVTNEDTLSLQKMLDWNPRYFISGLNLSLMNHHCVGNIVGLEREKLINDLNSNIFTLISFYARNHEVICNSRSKIHLSLSISRIIATYTITQLIAKMRIFLKI